MALKFTKIEPVTFGDLVVEPTITQEVRLRIGNLKIAESKRAEIARTIARAFKGYESEVEEFIKENMSMMDLSRLQAYLVNGASGLEDLERRIRKNHGEQMKKIENQKTNIVISIISMLMCILLIIFLQSYELSDSLTSKPIINLAIDLSVELTPHREIADLLSSILKGIILNIVKILCKTAMQQIRLCGKIKLIYTSVLLERK